VSGTTVRITDPNNQIVAGSGASQVTANTVDVPLGSITGNIQVNTLGGSDVLTLNLGSGDFIPAGGLAYAGGLNNDSLVIQGGAQGAVTYNYTNATDGSIVMGAFGTVSYTGLAPITNTGTATDIVFVLPGGGNVVTLGDGRHGRQRPVAAFERGHL
jgi:hypothetical protein